MTWIQFADKWAEGLGLLAGMAIVGACICVIALADAWKYRK